jgi:hypothetical protein
MYLHSFVSKKSSLNIILILTLIGAVLGGGCVDGEQYLIGEGNADEMPLLDEGNHLGFVIGFDDLIPAVTQDAIEERWNEAIESGLSTARVQLSWQELEPEPGGVNTQILEEILSDYESQGLQILLSITAYDSEGPEVPEDLMGKRFDDPVMISRFKALLEEIKPLLEKYRVYAISIANEPDNDFGEVENLENEMLVFLKEIKSYVRSFNKNIAVAITLAEINYGLGKSGMLEIIAESDIACWNVYGINLSDAYPFFSVQGEEELIADLQGMVDASMGKQIVIQEVGLHSGSTYLDSSEQTQRDFFKMIFQFMQNYPSIRAAYVFQLVDWSPETAAMLLDPAKSNDFNLAHLEYLQTLGLINYSDGTAKPAWTEFLGWLHNYQS